MLDLSTINFPAILVAALAAFFIGFMWHGPLFGKYWIKMMGIPQAEVDAMQAKGMGPMIPQMIAAYVQQVVMALVISFLANALLISDAMSAVMFAVMLWFGFIVTVTLNAVLWEKRKMDLYLFGIAYHLVSMVVVTLIVVLWR
jgi:Protein of unknown function (DUF1761)